MKNSVSVTAAVNRLLRSGSPVAMGVSGGKDSCTLAFAVNDYLNRVGHTGPRILIHSDLGRVEWKDSLPTCERLADAVGLELVTVRRRAGDMMDRWRVRWRNNLARYADLSCVKLILPWPTAAMRYCTSEMKTQVICRYLVERFPGRTIISASGIRADESPKRAKSPVVKVQPKLKSKTFETLGFDWHPILRWKKAQVFSYLAARHFPLHEAYSVYGSSRVSCAFCFLASQGDIRASAECQDNHDIYREMCRLEIESTFSFQADNWLSDAAPELLTAEDRDELEEAKLKAQIREAAEARIPPHLLYTKGWPTVMPTRAEAGLLAEIRSTVSSLINVQVQYLDADSILERYDNLMSEREIRSREKEIGRRARSSG